jgi:hypothetical protein
MQYRENNEKVNGKKGVSLMITIMLMEAKAIFNLLFLHL